MTYEERIAAAQAKMDEFKTKMADIAEKAKAARALKKEEISATIDEINAELDAYEDSVAAEIADTKARYEEVAAINAADQAAAVADLEATVQGDINAAKENIRLKKERADSKINSLKIKAQMKAEALQAKIAERREAKDKAAMECYILDLLDYAECCQKVAFAAAIEADLTLLEAATVAAEYIEKYGEPETEEA